MPKSPIVEINNCYAVCVGINQYHPSAQVKDLYCAENDAQELYNLLLRKGFPQDHCRLLLGSKATLDAIQDALNTLILDRPCNDDFVIFYFAGHGLPLGLVNDQKARSQAFLVAYNFDHHKITSNRGAWLRYPLRMERLRSDIFESTLSKKVLFIIDSCHSGDFYGKSYRGSEEQDTSDLEPLAHQYILPSFHGMAAGRVVLSSCMPSQKAREDRRLEHGLFTYHLLTALGGQVPGPVRNDGWITVSSLFDYLSDMLPANQRPVESGVKHGSFQLLYNPEHVKTAASSVYQDKHVENEHNYKEDRLKMMLSNHESFLFNHLSSFVGRECELVEIHQKITELIPGGGYVTITGQAGQGKSTIIAKLVQEFGPSTTAHHFILFNPGPDYQVSLLRDVMAQLILKYELSDLFVANENRTALRDAFPKVLREVVAKGGQETIFIDGLDQLQEDANGERDLSFLPNNPPQGIVFVLGTRPDDTLRPLELRKPRIEYNLPNLSLQDFILILDHHKVKLNKILIEQFYEAMQKNALYLDLAAKELAQEGAAKPEEVIKSVTDNPDDIFRLSIERLQRKPNDVEWREVLKPILGVLLVAAEPLTSRHLRQILEIRRILGIDDYRLRKGLMRLGGLVTNDRRQRYSLFHLKLFDYLKQDENNPHKEHIFATDEEEGWHKTLANWCEMGNLVNIWEDAGRDVVEQGRREYARHHYITHLYLARQWQRMFAVLDDGGYGHAKMQFDLSTRSYTQDLELGRKAVVWKGWTLDEAVSLLPYMWRYTLLKCSLMGRADSYSLEMFETLVALKREREALGIAELLTNQNYKVQALVKIANEVQKLSREDQENIQILIRAYEVAQGIELKNEESDRALSELSCALAKACQWERAETISSVIENESIKAETLGELSKELARAKQLEQAEAIASVIENRWIKDKALAELSKALAQEQHWERAVKVMRIIGTKKWRAKTLQEMGTVLAQTLQWERAEAVWTEAEKMAHSIEDNLQKVETLRELGVAYAQAQRWGSAASVWVEAILIARFLRVSWERVRELRELGTVLAQVQQLEQAIEIWNEVKTHIHNINVSEEKVKALRELATSFAEAQQLEKALELWNEAEVVAYAIKSNLERAESMSELSKALTIAQQWKRAENIAISIEEAWQRGKALSELGKALAYAQQWEQAEVIWAKAEEVTRKVELKLARAKALCELSKALARAQRWEQAQMVALSVEGIVQRIMTLINLRTKLKSTQQKKYIRSVENEIQENMSLLGWIERGILLKLSKSLIQIRQWEYARIVWDIMEGMWSISEMDKRAEELAELSGVLVQEKQWNWAASVAIDIAMSAEGLGVLLMLSDHLVKAQEWQRAENLWILALETFADPSPTVSHVTAWETLKSLLELGIVLVKSKQKRRAVETWAKAEKLVYSIERGVDRTETQKELSTVLARAKQWGWAEAVARSIESQEERDEALSELSSALVSAQQWNRAEIVARSIVSESKEARSLVNLWTTLMLVKPQEQTKQMWRRVEQTALSVGKGWDRVGTLRMLSKALAQTQQWKRSEEIARSIDEVWSRAAALQELSQILAEFQQWEQSEEVARTIELGEVKVRSLQNLGTSLALVNMWKRAEEVWTLAIEAACTMLNDEEGALVLQELSQILAEFQQWEQSKIAASSIKVNEKRDRALRDIVRGLAQMKRWEFAEIVANSIEDKDYKIGALRDLTEILAENKKYELILELIQRLWIKLDNTIYTIRLLQIANDLIILNPEIGTVFYESFSRVDSFLKG